MANWPSLQSCPKHFRVKVNLLVILGHFICHIQKAPVFPQIIHNSQKAYLHQIIKTSAMMHVCTHFDAFKMVIQNRMTKLYNFEICIWKMCKNDHLRAHRKVLKHKKWRCGASWLLLPGFNLAAFFLVRDYQSLKDELVLSWSDFETIFCICIVLVGYLE